MNVGVVGNPQYDALRTILAHLADRASTHGITFHGEADIADLWPAPVPRLDGAAGVDVLFTFGGDGTLLRGARLVAAGEIPVLGVNLGRVGFLTTTTPETLDDALVAVAQGKYEIERRQVLEGRQVAGDGTERRREMALNDVVVHKAGVARVVQIEVLVDGEEVAQYSADGIIVATPTGSTAYSLSAGGPVVVPGVDGLVITAICPHTLAVRPIVVSGAAEVVLAPKAPWGDEVLVSWDGQVGSALEHDDRVVVRRSATAVKLIHLAKEGFFTRMRRKLQWGDLTDRERRIRAD